MNNMSNDLYNEEIVLAHQYRLFPIETKFRQMNLKNFANAKHHQKKTSPPKQSFFRVVALFFYESYFEDLTEKEEEEKAFSKKKKISQYVVGANSEACHITNSICAERSAISQFTFLPIKRIDHIVIATDSDEPITPGVLCREYMASNDLISMDNTPIILSSSKCQHCNAKIDDILVRRYNNSGDSEFEIQNECCEGRKVHNFMRGPPVTIRDLYPHPSIYTCISSRQALKLGQMLKSSASKLLLDKKVLDALDSKLQETLVNSTDLKKSCVDLSIVNFNSHKIISLIEKAAERARISSNIDMMDNLHPIRYGAAFLHLSSDNAEIITSFEKKALEYGCTLDAVTQLVPFIIDNRIDSRESKEPFLIVQCDQFGICHAPFAKARCKYIH